MRVLVVLSITLSFVSCDNDLVLDLPKIDPKLVVESYLSVGDSLIVRIGESEPPNQNALRSKMTDAAVEITTQGQTFVLSYASYGFGTRDGNFYYLPKNQHQVQPSVQYDLKVQHKGRTATGSIVTISQTTILRSEAYQTVRGSDSTTIIRMEAGFPNEAAYYELSWNVPFPFKINDTLVVTLIGRVFHTDLIHQPDSPKTIEFDIGQKGPATPPPPSTYLGFLKLNRITKLQHDFLLAIDAQKKDYSLFTETTDIPTNIQGGYGIFTSTATDTLTVSFVQ